MPEENNEDIDRMSYVGLLVYHHSVGNKLMDSILTKEERAELVKKKRILSEKLRERKGEWREILKKGISNEQRQKTIENAEFILKRVSPEMREDINTIVDHLKRGLEKRKTLKTCPHCRKHISLKARFCNRCGIKIENKN